MSSAMKLEQLPNEMLVHVVDYLDLDSARNLRNTSKSMRDLVNVRKEKFYCENYLRKAKDLTDKCNHRFPSRMKKICKEKYNLCGPLNVKAFVIPGTNTVTVPYGTTWVGRNTFSDLTKEFHIVLPKTVIIIDDSSLFKNPYVKKVFAPGVERIDTVAFYECGALVEFQAFKLKEIGFWGFFGCRIETFNGSLVTIIGASAFRECRYLRDFNASQVQYIREYSFSNCIALKKLEFPQLLEIGDHAFQYCGELREFKSPLLKSIPRYAFWRCDKLRQITISKNTKVELYAIPSWTKIIYHEDLSPTLVDINGYTF